ncbi:TPA: DUF2723 domain-containing protein, partial [Candidatus Poribacteria bacterium]|nr:DUF2723 domain-containing protein [Candidatus Poribacteria bacterium]
MPIRNAILSTIKETKRRNLLFQKLMSVLSFLIPFLIYLKTLAPTVTWRDGGDFATACYVLGIPHPTGYPLYVLLGKLFTFLPVGDVAYRLNLMSAIFAAATCFVLYHIVLHLTQKHIPAFLAALSLAFSFTFWTQAVIVEVYSLNAFFLSALIFLLLKWRKTRKTYLLYLFAFLCGLSFANHISTIFIVPAAIVFVFMVDFHETVRRMPILFGLFLLGLTPYLYLPIRSAQNPPLDWGNPETFNQFLWVVTAAQYRGKMFSGSLSQVLDSLNQYRIAILNEFTIFGCLVGIIGFLSIIAQVRNHLKRHLPVFLLFILIFLADLIYTINFRIPDAPPFYIPSYVIFA